jgi:antitoxin (DNA-binding transcriptional repressor) of toxin-antitoxin stability system
MARAANKITNMVSDSLGCDGMTCTLHLHKQLMKSLSASEFRRQCLALLDHLPPEGIVITRRGRPVARITPLRNNNADLIGKLAGKFQVRGDILSTGIEWDAES